MKRSPVIDMTSPLATVIPVTGPLDSAKANFIAAQLRRLRNPHRLVIVHIRSAGGEVAAFYELLRVLAHHAKTRRIVTVAERAGSAAAYLLVCAEWACVEEGTIIHLHGIGWQAASGPGVLRAEALFSIGAQLSRENRTVARTLATSVALRLARRYSVLLLAKRSALATIRPERAILRFVECLRVRVSARTSKRLLQPAIEKFTFVVAVSGGDRPAPSRRANHVAPAAVFHSTIGYAPNVRRLEGGEDLFAAIEIAMDFALACGAMEAPAGRVLDDMAGILSVQARRRKAIPAEKRPPPVPSGVPLPFWLWCFAFTLCSRLVAQEHAIPASDAYWLGLIDQVLPSGHAVPHALSAAAAVSPLLVRE